MTRGSLELLKLNRLIHEPERLMILTALYPVAKMEYLRLQREWKFKQGNLSFHLGILEKAGYVAVEKKFKGKYPQTWCSMTKKGRETLEAYAQMMKSVVRTTGRETGAQE
jgi:DNA-binding HxlR family transcriptional regulator